ncbi:DNA-packaging protein [Roseitalea porphyridii]|uniref:DNA-packaging protein n=1 Tax=Roseitalea porphyridii TaxID=1852022 RepID=UPI0035B56A75
MPENARPPWCPNEPSTLVRRAALTSGPLALREAQKPPRHQRWSTWLLLGGRGSGKTRAGAEWVHGLASAVLPFARTVTSPIALVGETLADVREVMIDGPAGILACARHNRPVYEATRRRLVWPNGVVAQAFSAHDPGSLRGPQFAAAWCDEAMKWPHPREAWDMLQFGLRLGDWPRLAATTTPRPLKLLAEIMADAATVTTRMRTVDNAANLAGTFLARMRDRYGGTRLGRQELDAEILAEREDALWTRAMLDRVRIGAPADYARIVVAVDPPASAKQTSDACGIVVAGMTDNGAIHVLGDHSVSAAAPSQWAGRAVAAYHAAGADILVAEVNQGGDMVRSVIATVDDSVNVRAVRATRGKWLRAEPVAALYEQGRVRHVGVLAELEDEMCDFGLDGLSSNRSPDRLDALVWAIAELVAGAGGKPRVRAVR